MILSLTYLAGPSSPEMVAVTSPQSDRGSGRESRKVRHKMEIDPDVRRLPVYLILDCSASMSGPPIEAVKEGLKMLIRDLCREPWSLGTVWLSVITFSSVADQIIPLTEISKVQEPELSASGQTSLGLALKKLGQCMDVELRKRTAEHRGDYRPVVYLLTDGRPTDSGWEAAAQEIRERRVDSFVACAAGADADEAMLQRITSSVVRLKDASPESLRAFIRWVSQSVQVKSRSVGVTQSVAEPPLEGDAVWAAQGGGDAMPGGASLRPKDAPTIP